MEQTTTNNRLKRRTLLDVKPAAGTGGQQCDQNSFYKIIKQLGCQYQHTLDTEAGYSIAHKAAAAAAADATATLLIDAVWLRHSV